MSRIVLNLVVTDTLPFWAVDRFVCGDADRDSRPEVYLDHNGLLAVEYMGANRFDTTQLLSYPVRAWDLGDGDGDGLADLLCQSLEVHCANALLLYEARDSFSHPDTLVWADTVSGVSAMEATFLALDADSLPELTRFPHYPLFESTGDNEYTAKDSLVALPPAGTPIVLAPTWDMDRDGKPDAVASAGHAHVALFEAAANDSFVCVAVCSLGDPDGTWLEGCTATPDMDGDGLPEAIVLGFDWQGTFSVWVLESPSNDTLVPVWRTDFPGAGMPYNSAAAGDIDGDSIFEFAFTDDESVRVYRCVGPDQYEQCWSAWTPNQPVGIYDINSDGYGELFFSLPEGTVICQYVSGGIVANEAAQLRGVEVSPSILRLGASLHLSGLPADARVELLDVSGRVRFSSCSSLIPLPSSLAPGLFFVRVSSGSQSITRKVLVVE